MKCKGLNLASPSGSLSIRLGAGPHQGSQQCKSCIRCGKPRHATPDKCQAPKAICCMCQRKGHIGGQCISKTVVTKVEVDSEEETFLGAVRANNNTALLTNIKYQGTKAVFGQGSGGNSTQGGEAETAIQNTVWTSSPKM